MSGGLPRSSEDFYPRGSFCSDVEIDSRLAWLHNIARIEGGSEVQRFIDAYLACVAYIEAGTGGGGSELWFARMLVMSPTDSPQEGTLPDLGVVIRSLMVGNVASVKAGPKAQASGSVKAGEGGGPAGIRQTSGTNKQQKNHSVSDGLFQFLIGEDNFSVQMLFQALPCLRRGQKRFVGSQSEIQVGLNVLLGLLLGLYPHAAKFPPFSVRVNVFREVHLLLTGGSANQFCSKHPMLFVLAYMEYCAHVIPNYFPVEMAVLSEEPGMKTFFQTCPLLCDVFRQECLNETNGELSWPRMESHCAQIVDKHSRLCKNRFKARKDEQLSSAQVDQAAISAFASLPLVKAYDVHREDGSHFIIGSELGFLHGMSLGMFGCGIEEGGAEEACRETAHEAYQETSHESTLSTAEGNSLETTEALGGDSLITVGALQGLIQVHPLPRNMVRMQLRALYARMRVCERSALEATALYICLSCSLAGNSHKPLQVRGRCRLQVGWEESGADLYGDQSFICSVCQKSSVIKVGTLGRVVGLRNQRFFLAPCCLSVQVYNGSGVEFQTEFCDPDFFGGECMERNAWRPDIRPEMCCHGRARVAAKLPRPRCDICVETSSGGTITPEVFSAVDHLTGEMRYIRLCPRHTPHAEILKHVANWAELIEEVRKRDRPLFSKSAGARNSS